MAAFQSFLFVYQLFLTFVFATVCSLLSENNGIRSAYTNDPVLLKPAYHMPNSYEQAPYNYWHENRPFPHVHGDRPEPTERHKHSSSSNNYNYYGAYDQRFNNFITDSPIINENANVESITTVKFESLRELESAGTASSKSQTVTATTTTPTSIPSTLKIKEISVKTTPIFILEEVTKAPPTSPSSTELITPQSLHIGESALKMKKSTTKRPPAVGSSQQQSSSSKQSAYIPPATNSPTVPPPPLPYPNNPKQTAAGHFKLVPSQEHEFTVPAGHQAVVEIDLHANKGDADGIVPGRSNHPQVKPTNRQPIQRGYIPKKQIRPGQTIPQGNNYRPAAPLQTYIKPIRPPVTAAAAGYTSPPPSIGQKQQLQQGYNNHRPAAVPPPSPLLQGNRPPPAYRKPQPSTSGGGQYVVPPIVHPTPLRTPPCARGSSCSSRIDIELEIECEWCIKEVIVEVCLAKCRQARSFRGCPSCQHSAT